MQGKLSPGLSILILVTVATSFAANHVAARTAFDHGVTVLTGTAARAIGTALVVFVLMKSGGVAFALPRPLIGRAVLSGVLMAVQSFCLYSAVARIPVALALLVFNTCPMLYMLLSWAMGKEAPRPSGLAAMLVALSGLSLALGIRVEGFADRWSEIGVGFAWALAAAVAFTVVLYSNAHWLKAVDGRLRTFVMTSVAAFLMLVIGGATDALALPRDGHGWLGVALLTAFYCAGTCTFFILLPRLDSSALVALNFEPIALLGLGWVFLGQSVAPLQIFGAFIAVGAIAWLGTAKR